MNRRKPQLRVAVVPVEAGEDEAAAVLRKAGRSALEAAFAQGGAAADASRHAFLAGYLAGYTRHAALKHGVDAEQGEDGMAALLRQLAVTVPEALAGPVLRLSFSPRSSPRTSLRADDPAADAGYLVGHLESLCGTRRLLALALEPGTDADAAARFLTACDHAADRLQTHQPTAVLRFHGEEREAVSCTFL